ncbi:MAG: hypothetical protein HWE30_16705 [Methylocystaceae bacterium]|nr:hypothetical protein [Methylocystaceae bacterium]
MNTYSQCLEQTKNYIDAFNKQCLHCISDLLDEAIISSSQRREGVQVGKACVLARVSKFWARAEKFNKKLEAALGIIDLDDTPAHPCMVVFANKKAIGVFVFEVGKAGKIYLLSSLRNKDFVKRARLTDKR